MVADKSPSHEKRTVRFRIRRQDQPDGHPRWEEFDVEVEPGANITSCLQSIAADPKTTGGKETTPVAYEAACLEEVCGSCTMLVNGHVRQACSALIDAYAPRNGDVITLEPMTKFPVIRDLFVDRERMFYTLKRLHAWVPIDGVYDLGPGPQESPEQQQVRYRLSTCMSCGCCLEACPQFNIEPSKAEWDTSFVGAAAIGQTRLFNEHETAAQLEDERMDIMLGEGGINDCGNAQNCVKVCPKEIPLTEAIAAVGRAATIHGFKRFFRK